MIQDRDKRGRREGKKGEPRAPLKHLLRGTSLPPTPKQSRFDWLWRKLIWLIAWPVALWRVTGGWLVRRLRPPQQIPPPLGFRFCGGECENLVRESNPPDVKCDECEAKESKTPTPLKGMKFCGNCGMPNLPKDDPADVCEPCAEAMWQQHEDAGPEEPDPPPATLTWTPGEDRQERPSMEVPVPTVAEPEGMVRVVTVRTGKMCARCGRLPADEDSDLCWQCESVPASQSGPAPKLPPHPPRIPDVDHVQLPPARSRLSKLNVRWVFLIGAAVSALVVILALNLIRGRSRTSPYGPPVQGIQMVRTSDRTVMSWEGNYYDVVVVFCPDSAQQYKLSRPYANITHAGVSHCHGFGLRSSKTGKWLRFGPNTFPGHMAELSADVWVAKTW